MVKFIEIWCMNNQGMTLFYHKSGNSNGNEKKNGDTIEVEDALLISGLFSAIQTMAHFTMEDEVTLIEMNNSKLLFDKKDGIFVIGRILSQQNTLLAQKSLKIITDKFTSNYKEILNDWIGNTVIFENFKEKISDYIIPNEL